MDINQSIQLAFQNYQEGNLQQAQHICTKILEKQPNNEVILYLIGIVYARLEEYDLAIQHIKMALQFNINNPDAYLALGSIFQQKGLADKAINSYRKAIEIDPNYAEAYENMGDLFREKGQLNEAVDYYKKAIKYFPNSAEIYYNLGNIFKEKGQYDLSTFYYRTALKYKPDYVEVYNNLGIIFKNQRRLDEAITYYQKVLQLNPKCSEAYFNLAVISQEKGQLDEAITYYQKALQLNPKCSEAYFNLAVIFLEKGRLDEAITYYQKNIGLNFNTTAVCNNLGQNILINYADKGFWKAQQFNALSGYACGFDKVITYNRDFLDAAFVDKNKFILNRARGAGYWLWKPYIILKTLREANKGDIVFYCDSGARFISSISPLIKLCNEESIVLFGQQLLNKAWTKRDAFFYMQSDAYDKQQITASFMLFKHSKKALDLMEEFLAYCSDARIITDDSNTCGLDNFPEFNDHRHDQSIMSLLASKYNIKLHRDPSQWGNDCKALYKGDDYGQIIEHTRSRV